MSIKYEDIVKANQAIKTTDIKGKNYAEVTQRVKAFRMVFPTGTISTQMVSNENGVCIFHATAGYWDEAFNEYIVLGEGTAYEKEGSSFINKTSYIENCETSAVGRALGMAGFGIDESMASYEEVANAKLNQDKKYEVTQQEMGKMKLELLRTGYTETSVCKTYGVKDITELSHDQYKEFMVKIKDVPDREDIKKGVK